MQLVESCLSNIHKHETTIHAWVVIDEEGARKTARSQERLLESGLDPGPLAGIPIGVKDIIDVQGFPTRAGAPPDLKSPEPISVDAAVVAKLRAAGAIILGKTVTTQFACMDPSPTRNPWKTSQTPGGSSSGSAAAVALGMCMFALGTQTGGSIIRPSSYCGVVGLKPTHGRVSMDGIVPVSRVLDHVGPVCACVSDARIIYSIMNDARDDESLDTASKEGFLVEPCPEKFFLLEEFLDRATPMYALYSRTLSVRYLAWRNRYKM